MGNKSAKKTTSFIDQERGRQTQEHNTDRGYYTGRRDLATNRDDSMRDEIAKGYRGMIDGEGFSGGFGGGGYTPQTFTLDPSLIDLEGKYKNLSGGLDRALTGYDEFATTGGYSDKDRADLRARGGSSIPQFYANLRNEMSRRSNMSGMGSGFTAALNNRLDRNMSRAAAEQNLDVETSLADRIRQGRLAGLSGIKEIGSFGYGGVSDIANQRQRILEQNINEQNQAAASAAASAGADARYRQQLKMAGLGGLENLYFGSPGETSRYDDLALRERFGTNEGIERNLQTRLGSTGQERSAWDRISQIGGAVAGGLAPW